MMESHREDKEGKVGLKLHPASFKSRLEQIQEDEEDDKRFLLER